jgi:hypothetical protein
MSGRPSIRAALAALILAAAGAAGSWAATPGVIADSYVILEDEVQDLRANAGLRLASGADIGDYASIADVQVGALFIADDGTALRVTAVTRVGNEITVEAETPPLQLLIAEAYMPDQTVKFTSANIVPGSMQKGVTLLESGAASSLAPRKDVATGPTWIDTDTYTDVQASDIIAVGLDFSMSKEWSGQAYGIITGTIGGELGLKGQLRVSDPVLKGGFKMPAIHIKWVKVWAFIGYPKITFEKGYIHASFASGEQIDAKLYGTATLGVEIKIPLYELIASDPDSVVTFTIGLYLKISAEGSITLAFETNEYARLGIWGTVELTWPFIPTDVSAGSDFYYDFAVRPSLAGSIEVKAGPYVGLEGTLLGVTLIGAEIGGGLYAEADGSIEAADVLGLDKTVGTYGSFAHWVYNAHAEAGGYIEATLNILDLWDTTLLDKKWPFIQITGKGGF